MFDQKLEASWQRELSSELKKEYIKDLTLFLDKERRSGVEIYPQENDLFLALNLCPFDKVKVVILGQDPYHGPGQAHGLCFSVPDQVKVPPSLRNIFKELQNDVNFDLPEHGNLIQWSKQGVLLLNNVLTVRQGQPASHHNKGWEKFTDKVIEVLAQKKKHLVFLLWGAPAQKKLSKVDTLTHLVLTAPHPSPLSSYRGFFGCKHFSKCNDYLNKNQMSEIDWSL